MFDVSLYSYEQLIKIFETAVLNMWYDNEIIEIKRDSMFNRRISGENDKFNLIVLHILYEKGWYRPVIKIKSPKEK